MAIKRITKRGGAAKTLASHAGKITKPIFGGRGFADGAIINDWPIIAGEHFASHSMPERITYQQGRKNRGTLHLRVESGGWAMQLQHLEAVLIDRINVHFGFNAIERIHLIQAPLPERTTQELPPVHSLTQSEELELQDSLNNVDDDDLHQALAALGRAVLGKTFKEKP